MTRLAVALIRLYRQTMPSVAGLFWVSTQCRHIPSCSHYAEDAIQNLGVIKGSWLSVIRISRCQPWTQPQIDPAPSHNG